MINTVAIAPDALVASNPTVGSALAFSGGSPPEDLMVSALFWAGMAEDKAIEYVTFCLTHAIKDGPREKHHILTRKVFPEFIKSKENLVGLRPADHLRAHYLLAVACPDVVEFVWSFNMMISIRGVHTLQEGGYTESEIDAFAQMYEAGKIVLKSLRIAHNKKMSADPKFAAERDVRLAALNANPKFAAERDARLAAIHADPKFAAEQSARMTVLNADPKFKNLNNHVRHHVNRGLKKLGCIHCYPLAAVLA